MSKISNLQDFWADPLRFDMLLAEFQSSGRFEPTSQHLTELTESAFVSVHQSMVDEDTLLSFKSAIEEYPQPSMIISETGQIVAINQPAYRKFDLEISDNIDESGISVIGGATLSGRISRAINLANDENQTAFCRATFRDDARPVTLAIVPHRSSISTLKTALVFFVDIGWNEAISRYFSDAYALSHTEREILVGFILGENLEQIAMNRNRSVQTVRTQFYAALKKCGFTSQVDLVREVVAGSMFQSLVPRVERTTGHPHRRELRMLRPRGRTLEVVASGDPEGTPVFLAASFGIQKFAPQKTKMLHDAGICVYAISPPGYGDTSRHPEGTDRMTCFADDVASVLDQLNLKSVPFVAVGASVLPTVRLAQKLPDRISGIQSFITVPPTKYLHKINVDGKISVGAAMSNALMMAPGVYKLVARSALRAWSILGVRKMAKIQSQSEPAVAPFLLDPDTLQAADEGFRSAIRQGFGQAFLDAEEVFSNWYDDAVACPVPITLVHGQNDKTTSIQSVRDFAKDLPDKITLIEVEDGGSFLHITHDKVYIDRLLAFSAAYPAMQHT